MFKVGDKLLVLCVMHPCLGEVHEVIKVDNLRAWTGEYIGYFHNGVGMYGNPKKDKPMVRKLTKLDKALQ